MGPILIFDKSFLESLTVDESVWLDNFFLCNITPLFYVETLADLEKGYKKGKIPRSSEEIVKEIAGKTPVMSHCPSMHHHQILIGELMGQKVDVVNRRIHTHGGRYVKYPDGSLGVDFKQFPEDSALYRWKAGAFKEVEENVAKSWREALSNFDYDQIISIIDREIDSNIKIDNLLSLKKFVDVKVKSKYKSFIHFALNILDLPQRYKKEITQRWQNNNWQSFEEFSPYAAYVLKVDLFFYLGLKKGLIGKERASSNRIDISYLYYLPFAHVFVSSDKLHRRIAPLFIDQDQSFVVGEDLKDDLKNINDFYLKLPQVVKNLGVYGFANHPPIEIDTLVGRLYDKHLKPWRERAKNSKPGLPKTDPDLIKKLKEQKRNQEPYLGPAVNSDDVGSMILTRRVPINRGSWNLMPKDFKKND